MRELRIMAAVRAIMSSLGFGSAASTDGTFGANSDALIPTQKAVKTYVDASVIGLFDFKGSTDCSANPNYPVGLKGDYYLVSVAGKIGGASGTSVDAGDAYVAIADNAGGTEAGVGGSWAHVEHNLIAATLAPVMDGVAAVGTGTKYAREDHVHPVDTSRLAVASNLSDVAAPATAAHNLGLGTADSPTFTGLALTSRPVIGGITPPAVPKYPTTAAEFAALMLAGTGTTGIVAADVYEIWMAVGARLRAMLDPTNKSLTEESSFALTGTAGIFSAGTLPYDGCPKRGVSIASANANAGLVAAANTVADLAALTAANDMCVLAPYCSASANANYTCFSKYQAAGGPLWDFGVTSAGEQQIYLNDGTHFVAPVTSGKALRDGRVHFLAWGFDWGAAGAELKMCSDGGAQTTSTKGTVTAVTNTGKFHVGGDGTSSIASAEFATDHIIMLKSANLASVSYANIQAAIGITGAI